MRDPSLWQVLLVMSADMVAREIGPTEVLDHRNGRAMGRDV